MNLYFVTGNKGKFEEVKSIFQNTDMKIDLKQISLDIPELDSQDLIEISQDKAIQAFRRLQKLVLVDDSGIYFDEYSKVQKDKIVGFPGPLAKRVFMHLGYKGLYRLLKDADKKTGVFITVVSYMDSNLSKPISFVGQLKGVYDFLLVKNAIPEQLEKYKTLPYKYIFKPEGFDKFYSELADNERLKISQRSIAIGQFLKWFEKIKDLKNYQG